MDQKKKVEGALINYLEALKNKEEKEAILKIAEHDLREKEAEARRVIASVGSKDVLYQGQVFSIDENGALKVKEFNGLILDQ